MTEKAPERIYIDIDEKQFDLFQQKLADREIEYVRCSLERLRNLERLAVLEQEEMKALKRAALSDDPNIVNQMTDRGLQIQLEQDALLSKLNGGGNGN